MTSGKERLVVPVGENRGGAASDDEPSMADFRERRESLGRERNRELCIFFCWRFEFFELLKRNFGEVFQIFFYLKKKSEDEMIASWI